MNVLGIWDGHDAGAALLVDGRLAAAVNEERFTRRKLEVAFPAQSIEACLTIAGMTGNDIEVVACCTTDPAKALGRVFPATRERYYRIRRRKVDPSLLSRFGTGAKYALTEWRPNMLSRWASAAAVGPSLRRAGLNDVPLRFYDHHRCHATAAAFTSGFDSCVVLTIDGLGDGAASTVNVLRHGRLDLVASTPAWHSPGVFFEHVTHLLNMRELEDEGKVMALADYASPVDDAFNPMLGLLRADGLSFATPVPSRRLAGPLRKILWRFPNEQFAFMAQRTLERACTSVADHALRATGERRIALAGGVASNIKINRRIRLLEGVDDVYVFPHMGDGGLALGAALQAVTDESAAPRLPLEDLGLGPAYLDGDVAATLQAHQLTFRPCANIASTVADLVATDQVVLWFQGAMEYGPRALGHRSVLARPDRPRLRDRLNLVLKRRVWYQPFCPSILERDARAALSDFTGRPNRHMTMAYQVAESHREALAGVMNVDGSCRPQMVAEDDPDIFAELLRAMRQRIGIGALLNTSFNLHGEPLVCTPDQAVRVFIETGADALAIGRFLVHRPA